MALFFRVRVNAFLAGFAVAGGACLWKLRQDIWSSHRLLESQALTHGTTMEERVSRLEKAAGLDTKDK